MQSRDCRHNRPGEIKKVKIRNNPNTANMTEAHNYEELTRSKRTREKYQMNWGENGEQVRDAGVGNQ